MKLVASSSQEPNRQDFNEIQESEDMLDYEKMLKARGKEEKPSVNLEGEVRSEFAEIVGASPALKATLNLVSVVARTDSSVLILGETGTGKELIARAIHNLNDRRERPAGPETCGNCRTSLSGQ